MANRNQSKEKRSIHQQISLLFDEATLSNLLHMEQSEDIDALLLKLEKFIEHNFRGLTSSQFRKLYSDIVKLEQATSINQLRPQFAYLIARQPNDNAKKIMVLADALAKKASATANLKGFKKAIETMLAFHRFHELLFSRRVALDRVENEMWRSFNPIKIENLLDIDAYSNPDQLFDKMEAFVESNARDITSTQLRKIYDKVLSAHTVNEIKVLRPFFAYTAARQERLGAVKIMMLLMKMCQKLEQKESAVKKFKKSVQAVVSIHKYIEATSERRRDNEQPRSEKLLQQGLQYFKKSHSKEVLNAMNATTSYGAVQSSLTQLILKNMEGIKSAQLRRLYDVVQEKNTVQEIKQLRPLFLYTIARQNNDKAKRIMLLLVDMMKHLQKGQAKLFKQFLEDIVSYHKYFEVAVTNDYNKKNLFL